MTFKNMNFQAMKKSIKERRISRFAKVNLKKKWRSLEGESSQSFKALEIIRTTNLL